MTRRRRIGALIASLTGLTGLLVVMLPSGTAFAHGAYIFPASRTYACYVNGIEGGQGGALDPTNPACADALEQGGNYAFYNWFGNLLSNVDGRHREVIPNGNLCGPSEQFAAFRMARTDWPTTEVRAGANVIFRWAAWAAHPGTFTSYVTKDGWNPNEPLGWDDLEAQPFDEITNPPKNGSGPEGAEYTWEATLPNKSGRHIIYTIWERSDSPESFYSCSDVIFTGGEPDNQPPTAPGTPTASQVTGTSVELSWAASSDNLAVDGYDVYREAGANDELVASTAATSATVTGLSPQTTYSFYVVARDTAGNTSPASSTVTVTTGDAPPTGSCSVSYTLQSEWHGGFTAQVEITNTGDTAINGWTLEFDFPGDQTLTNGWSATWSQAGDHVTAENLSWNAGIQPGQTVTAGFNADASTDNPAPTAFLLNGASCTT